jgi:sn-glycerol 3-phosphate transport system substrate-binding protein
MQTRLKLFLISLIFITIDTTIANKIEIKFWHSMAGQLGNALNNIVAEFNNKNPDYYIKTVYKGTYPETLTSTVAAFRAGAAPDIVQIFDIATATMINPRSVIIPVHEIFSKTGITIPLDKMIQPAIDYYSDSDDKLLALPFNISTPALFYNKDLFKKAGLNPNAPPMTWDDVNILSKVLIQKGLVTYGFSGAWIGWTLFESFSLVHNLPFVTNNNGFDSIDVKVAFGNSTIKSFIKTLYNWQKSNVFLYGGRLDDAQSFFTSEKCAMLIQSSGSYADIQSSVNFELGMARIPYLGRYKESELGNLIGGAAIWVLAGLSEDKWLVVAEFLRFIMSPKIQLQWQSSTGYISVINSKYLPNKKPLSDSDIMLFKSQEFVISRENRYKGIRMGNYMQIRDLIERQLEAVWAGYSSVDEALDLAAEEANRMLKRFKRNIK